MKKIGLTQRVLHVKEINERRDCLEQEWPPLLEEMGFLPVPIPNCIKNIETWFENIKFSGIILTGGNDISEAPQSKDTAPERDALEGKLLDLCAHKKIPILGVCRGLQKMVLHYGGALKKIEGHNSNRHIIIPIDAYSSFFKHTSVNSFHTYGVESLGPDLIPMAKTSENMIEAIVHKTYPQWAIMWHPERDSQEFQDLTLLKYVFKRN